MSEITRSGAGFVVLTSTWTDEEVRGVLVAVAGNMAVQLADGSDNNANAVAVTAGQFFPLQARKITANNTATLLGVL